MARSRRNVRVLLVQDRPPLGLLGDVVEVRPGYAHNFLLPGGVAALVTPDALRRIEKQKKQAVLSRTQRDADLRAAAAQLEGLNLTINEKASEEGHLYGSVGTKEILEALLAREIPVEERQIKLEHPIKELGIFSVPIELGPDTSAQVRVWVVEQDA
ncbi:MAG: 50S ribosomal protein L9 [Planctomycetota bacterium]|nr:50S ribosomal protein L9 [Planctomycetota bacterium]